MTPFQHKAVADRFASYLPHVKSKMLALRELVLKTAAETPGAGEVEETLKWGEPAYVTKNKTGSTIRMDWKAKSPNTYALYFNCQTSLVESFRRIFHHDFQFEGNRALVFQLDESLPKDSVALCVTASLTYHVKHNKAAKSAA
ncbi:MAG: DUF1801 domain-containing protein [Comamonadaceae bacterium]|nr:DUF1801 domain-containing protein [Comamonadaceae bacterium]